MITTQCFADVNQARIHIAFLLVPTLDHFQFLQTRIFFQNDGQGVEIFVGDLLEVQNNTLQCSTVAKTSRIRNARMARAKIAR